MPPAPVGSDETRGEAATLAVPNQTPDATQAPVRPPASEPPPRAMGPSSPAASAGRHDAERGRAIYRTACAVCHGAEGRNDGPMSREFMVTPVRHDDGDYMNRVSNDHLFEIVEQGGPAVGKSPQMPGWGGFYDDDEIWSLVVYMRSLARPAYEGPLP